MSSQQDPNPGAKVVELRRWREERDRGLRAAAPPPPEPPRVPWFTRVLEFVFGRTWFRRLRFRRSGRSQKARLEGGLVEGEVGRRRAEHGEDPP
jgi:hypothetical protein